MNCPADDAHEVGCVVNIQIVGRFIQQDIFRVLCNDHGYIGTLQMCIRDRNWWEAGFTVSSVTNTTIS